MKNKIIVSSLYMFNRLREMRHEYLKVDEMGMIDVSCYKGALTFPENKFDAILCESRNDFEVKISVETLDRLISFVKNIQEQPIVLVFDDCGWIEVIEAIL